MSEVYADFFLINQMKANLTDSFVYLKKVKTYLGSASFFAYLLYTKQEVSTVF